MKRYNGGRGVVLIGHSQGTFHLRRLLRTEIDPKPALRRQLVSAVLLGGNVLVKRGQQKGGDFQNVPACRAASQTGCVIAYSLFNETPPDSPRFGKPPPAPDPVTGNPGGPGYEVLCTNPASLAANRQVPVETLFPSRPFPPGFIALSITQAYGGPPPSAPTPWLRPADRYTGRCETSNGANVLMIRPIGRRPPAQPVPGRHVGAAHRRHERSLRRPPARGDRADARLSAGAGAPAHRPAAALPARTRRTRAPLRPAARSAAALTGADRRKVSARRLPRQPPPGEARPPLPLHGPRPLVARARGQGRAPGRPCVPHGRALAARVSPRAFCPLALLHPEPPVQPAQRRRAPTSSVAEQPHQRRHEQRPHDRRVDEHADGHARRRSAS